MIRTTGKQQQSIESQAERENAPGIPCTAEKVQEIGFNRLNFKSEAKKKETRYKSHVQLSPKSSTITTSEIRLETGSILSKGSQSVGLVRDRLHWPCTASFLLHPSTFSGMIQCWIGLSSHGQLIHLILMRQAPTANQSLPFNNRQTPEH